MFRSNPNLHCTLSFQKTAVFKEEEKYSYSSKYMSYFKKSSSSTFKIDEIEPFSPGMRSGPPRCGDRRRAEYVYNKRLSISQSAGDNDGDRDPGD
jgi:hypothetical protein